MKTADRNPKELRFTRFLFVFMTASALSGVLIGPWWIFFLFHFLAGVFAVARIWIFPLRAKDHFYKAPLWIKITAIFVGLCAGFVTLADQCVLPTKEEKEA